ncbi:MAG: hypothetical protein ABI623_11910, partial [bacterium]
MATTFVAGTKSRIGEYPPTSARCLEKQPEVRHQQTSPLAPTNSRSGDTNRRKISMAGNTMFEGLKMKQVTMKDGKDIRDTSILDGEAKSSAVENEKNATEQYSTPGQP